MENIGAYFKFRLMLEGIGAIIALIFIIDFIIDMLQRRGE